MRASCGAGYGKSFTAMRWVAPPVCNGFGPACGRIRLAHTRNVVEFSGYTPGTIVVKTPERRLYYVLDEHRARRFPVGVGKEGKTWTGKARVEAKFYTRLHWAPPNVIRRDNPRLPTVVPGGSPNNPMGRSRLDFTRRGIRHSRHQQGKFNRRICFVWLYPYVQPRHPGTLPARACRHASHRRRIALRAYDPEDLSEGKKT